MLHAYWLSLCMINAHNVFLFFPFPLFVEIIEPTTSSPVTSPGQYPHTFTKYVWVLFSVKQDFCIVTETQPVASGPQACVWLWCLSLVLSLCDVFSLCIFTSGVWPGCWSTSLLLMGLRHTQSIASWLATLCLQKQRCWEFTEVSE